MNRRQRLLKLLPDEASTLLAGGAIAHLLSKQSMTALPINLIGDLGSGKTTLVRGVLRGLGYNGPVKSPTYPLLETYRIDDLRIMHFDLYRLETPEAFVEAGFEDYFTGPGVRFVEWPDRAGRFLPLADWSLALSEPSCGGRQLSLEGLTPRGQAILNTLSL